MCLVKTNHTLTIDPHSPHILGTGHQLHLILGPELCPCEAGRRKIKCTGGMIHIGQMNDLPLILTRMQQHADITT